MKAIRGGFFVSRLYLCGGRRQLAGKNRTGCGNLRGVLECNRFRNPSKKESNLHCCLCPPDRKGVRTCPRAMKHRARFRSFRCHGRKNALRNAESYFPQSTRVLPAEYSSTCRRVRRRPVHDAAGLRARPDSPARASGNETGLAGNVKIISGRENLPGIICRSQSQILYCRR